MEKKILLCCLSLNLLFTAPVYAKTFQLACPDLATCAQSVSALTGDQYIFSDNPQCMKVHATGDIELTAENANMLFSNALAFCAEGRVPIGPKVYAIKHEDEARRLALPKYLASNTLDPKIPDTADWITLIYQANHSETVKDMEDAVRTYANSSAKIYVHRNSGILMISDRADNIKSLLPLIHLLDVKKINESSKMEGEKTKSMPPKPNPKNKK